VYCGEKFPCSICRKPVAFACCFALPNEVSSSDPQHLFSDCQAKIIVQIDLPDPERERFRSFRISGNKRSSRSKKQVGSLWSFFGCACGA
jgi:hypothetical protein